MTLVRFSLVNAPDWWWEAEMPDPTVPNDTRDWKTWLRDRADESFIETADGQLVRKSAIVRAWRVSG